MNRLNTMSLVAGDRVGVVPAFGSQITPREVIEVSRVLKTQIVLSDGSRFIRHSGIELGVKGNYWKFLVTVENAKAFNGQLQVQKVRNDTLAAIEAVKLSTLSQDQLDRIHAIVTE